MLQTINRGTVANDGTGDPNRTAWGKVNDMMTELFGRPQGLRNKLVNGCFRFAQRGNGLGPNDNAYCLDRWRFLAEANGTAFLNRLTSSLPDGAPAKLTCNVAIANNKYGLFQVLEATETLALRGQKVALSADLLQGGLSDMRMAILEFTGTADSVSGDPISSWNAAGSVPTLATNWAYISGTPVALGVTTSFATYSVEATVGASANNLAVLIWSEDKTTTITVDGFHIAKAQLQIVEGKEDLPAFEPVPYALEYLRCARFYFKTYDMDVTPGTSTGAGVNEAGIDGLNSAVHDVRVPTIFPVPMRVIPSCTIYKADGTAGNWTGGASASVVQLGQKLVTVEVVTASGTEARVAGHLVASAEL